MGDADNAMADDKPSAEDDMTVLHISNLTRLVQCYSMEMPFQRNSK